MKTRVASGSRQITSSLGPRAAARARAREKVGQSTRLRSVPCLPPTLLRPKALERDRMFLKTLDHEWVVGLMWEQFKVLGVTTYVHQAMGARSRQRGFPEIRGVYI